jgi:acyl-CoA thioesterase
VTGTPAVMARGNAPVSPPSSCSSSLSECISRNGALDFLMRGAETDPEGSDGIVGRFNRCEYARLLGMEVTETWPGGARVRMEATGKRNSNGVIHGGAIFSLADHAFGLAANNGGTSQVAVSASISYLSPARGTLEAVAEQVDERADRSVFVVRVYEGELLVATFEGVGIKEQTKNNSNFHRSEN